LLLLIYVMPLAAWMYYTLLFILSVPWVQPGITTV